eukprot:scaffold27554_cov102-Isochrysis_galbana.AAC.2
MCQVHFWKASVYGSWAALSQKDAELSMCVSISGRPIFGKGAGLTHLVGSTEPKGRRLLCHHSDVRQLLPPVDHHKVRVRGLLRRDIRPRDRRRLRVPVKLSACGLGGGRGRESGGRLARRRRNNAGVRSWDGGRAL